MCGPIALSLPVHGRSQSSRFIAILVYNAGRIMTYSALGALFGLLGQGFAIFGLQQILSIVLGVIILLSVLLPGDIFAQFSFTSQLHQLF
ncbi:MAG TPA: sulfite exporter TauE/SafE family protein, partial [Bacteroidia bacterium]|nr:sulfite exporter TauE/SafE family protein [Bacteroidia bacterium]